MYTIAKLLFRQTKAWCLQREPVILESQGLYCTQQPCCYLKLFDLPEKRPAILILPRLTERD